MSTPSEFKIKKAKKSKFPELENNEMLKSMKNTPTKNERTFDCYSCEYRTENPGTHHIKCTHPSLKEVNDNPMLELMAIFASVGRVPPVSISSKEMGIKLNEYGVKNGWANFPYNFDPIWIENCNVYKDKKYKDAVESL